MSTASGWRTYSPSAAVALRFGLVIRTVTRAEAAHHFLASSSVHDTQSILKLSPQHKETCYAAVLRNNALGDWIGVVQWDNEALHISTLLVPRNDALVCALLADHATVSMPKSATQQMPTVSEFDDAGSVTVDQMNAVRQVCTRRPQGLGSPMAATFYTALMRLASPDVYTKTPHRRKQSLVLRVSVRYSPALAQKSHERSPRLHLYLSSNVSNSVQVVDSSTSERVLEFKLRYSSSIPSTCLLNVDQYAMYANEKGEFCLNQAGYANVQLSDLLRKHSCTMRLRVTNSRDAAHTVKGEFSITVLEATLPTGTHVAAPTSEALLRDRYAQCDRVISDYVERNRRFYSRYPATVRSVKNITVFLDQTRVGYLPGSMFDVFRVPKAREEYHLNQLHIAVQRRMHTSSPVDLSGEKWLQHPDVQFRVRTIMDMLTIYVNYCPYITDEVDHNVRGQGRDWNAQFVELIESFDNAFPRDAGDCEDFTRCILRLVMEIKFHGHAMQSSVMQKVRSLLHEFVFCSVLCGVSNKSLADMPVDGRTSSPGPTLKGHEGVFAIPKNIFYEALRRHNPDHIILAQLGVNGSTSSGEAHIVHILEGTGMLQPEPSSYTREERRAMKQLAHSIGDCPSLVAAQDSMRSTYHYDPARMDNFYKMMMACITPEFFLQGIPCVEFLLYYKVERRSSRSAVTGTRGVWFRHLVEIGSNPRVALASAPHITAEVVDAYNMVAKDDYPITRLRALEQDDAMRAVKDALDVQPREGLRAELGGDGCYTCYVRFDQLVEKPQLIRDIAEMATRSGLGIDVRVEPVRVNDDGHHCGGYAITYYA